MKTFNINIEGQDFGNYTITADEMSRKDEGRQFVMNSVFRPGEILIGFDADGDECYTLTAEHEQLTVFMKPVKRGGRKSAKLVGPQTGGLRVQRVGKSWEVQRYGQIGRSNFQTGTIESRMEWLPCGVSGSPWEKTESLYRGAGNISGMFAAFRTAEAAKGFLAWKQSKDAA